MRFKATSLSGFHPHAPARSEIPSGDLAAAFRRFLQPPSMASRPISNCSERFHCPIMTCPTCLLGLAVVRIWIQAIIYGRYAATDFGSYTVLANLIRGRVHRAASCRLFALKHGTHRPARSELVFRHGDDVGARVSSRAADCVWRSFRSVRMRDRRSRACMGRPMWIGIFVRLAPRVAFFYAFACLAARALGGLVIGFLPQTWSMPSQHSCLRSPLSRIGVLPCCLMREPWGAMRCRATMRMTPSPDRRSYAWHADLHCSISPLASRAGFPMVNRLRFRCRFRSSIRSESLSSASPWSGGCLHAARGSGSDLRGVSR